ncbi:Gaa1-like protein [Entophlyctis helioformis]|nr:Gaa1-like protein [Entophlyctis helioformis]
MPASSAEAAETPPAAPAARAAPAAKPPKVSLSREAIRIAVRRRIYYVLRLALGSFGLSFYLLGLIWLFLLPVPAPLSKKHDVGEDGPLQQLHRLMPRIHESVDTDEKALLVGQVNRYFGFGDQDFDFHSSGLGAQLWRTNITDSEQATLLADEFEKHGLDVSKQRFTFLGEEAVVESYNVHGIMRAPRGDGTEALVLVAPLTLHDGQHNANGIRFLFGLARFLKKFSFWSKDIILLVSPHNTYGVYSWLQAYHGFKPDLRTGLDFEPLDSHAGSIQSAVCLEFPGSHDYTAVGLFPEGINGQLPNADLLATVVLSIRYEGIPLVLHDGPRSQSTVLADRYRDSLAQLWTFVKNQASGLPTAGHALFLQYKIEAVTLRGLEEPGAPYSVGMVQVERAVETMLRSLNNLLEKFHHAYWFYFMPTAEHTIPLSMYIGPIALLAASLALSSLGFWWEGLPGRPQGSIYIDTASGKPYVHLISGESSFTNYIRPLFLPLVTLGLTFGTGAWFMANIDTIVFMASLAPDSAVFVASAVMGFQYAVPYYLMPLIHRLMQGSGASTRFSVAAWRILKLCCCGALGMVLIVLAAINPSLSILVAIPYVPIFLLVRPTAAALPRLLQIALLNIVSPPGVLIGYALITGDAPSVVRALSDAVRDWNVFGSQLVPFVCLLVWPLNMAAQSLVEMEL